MFESLMFQMRGQGLKVGLGEWLAFQRGLEKGLAGTTNELYGLGRSLLVHSEAHFDQYDRAFHAALAGIELDPVLSADLAKWLEDPRLLEEMERIGAHGLKNLSDLMEAFRKTMEEQAERHEGGNRWVGTGGTSPYGSGGRAEHGLALGQTRNRTGIRLPDVGRWESYRTDRALQVRDWKVALRALRFLERDGEEELDIDGTIAATARNGGDVEIVERRSRANRVRLTLLLDSGGSMAPFARDLDRLFTAAQEVQTFRSLETWHFHNCVYRYLVKDYDEWDRVPTERVLGKLGPEHRLLFVGDACMAPWELFSSYGSDTPSGLDWLGRFVRSCPATVWLNPMSINEWNHPTVRAVGELMPMYPLTLDGLRDAIRFLRSPR
ncbi:MAG: VWA domain-containing protein [Myxococcota bacterium]|nr:VWA domain-containing protein [Myxococcota bacterium]